MLNIAIFLSMTAVCVVLYRLGFWYVLPLLWLPMAHFGHAVLLAFHEAVHYTLSKSRLFNEFRGFFIGVTAGVPLSVYRHLHLYHHAYLSTPRDAELWPYNDPTTGVWFRRVCAVLEISLAYFWTPLVFLRGIVTDRKLKPKLRRRIVAEYALLIGFWATTLTVIGLNGWWPEFLLGYLAPAMMAATLQTLRKFVEHMGLVGDTPLTLTRTVVDHTSFGQWIAATMLYVSYHGTHHRFGKLAYHELPPATEKAYSMEPDPEPVYPNYWTAFWAMVPTLYDPKCGSLWLHPEVPEPVETVNA